MTASPDDRAFVAVAEMRAEQRANLGRLRREGIPAAVAVFEKARRFRKALIFGDNGESQ
jgi:hypothetical protein